MVYLQDRFGANFVLDEGTLALLERFRRPTFVDDVVTPGDINTQSLVRTLISAEILIPAEGREARAVLGLRPSACPAFGFAWFDEETTPADAVILLGACSDAGTMPGFRRGTAGAPDAIRDASQAILAHERLDTGCLTGWYDVDTDAWLLRGARVADAGNLATRPSVPAKEYGAVLAETIQDLSRNGTQPLLLGGDHSVTLSAVEAWGDEEVGILHFDAHHDLGGRRFDEDLHHGNVMRWIMERPNIRHLVQIGIRGLHAERPPLLSNDHRIISTRQARQLAGGELDAICRPELPYYVTVDIDVLDPSAAPDTPVPVADGLRLDELRHLIRALGERARFIGADLVEVLPGNGVTTTCHAAAEVALELLHGLSRRHVQPAS